MDSKLGTELYLATNINENEREKGNSLSIGYDEDSNEWELIIRYTNDLEDISKEIEFKYIKLLNNYAIVYINADLIYKLEASPNVIWIEKPKEYILDDINNEQNTYYQYSNEFLPDNNPINKRNVDDVIVCVIDSGINIYRDEFRDDSGRTLIKRLYDIESDIIYDAEEINTLLLESTNYDYSGHGTAVCGIISKYVSTNELLIIKLPSNRRTNNPRTTEIIRSIDIAIRYSIENNKPIVINISLGNNYGDHSGNSILEQYIDSVIGLTKCSIITGSGNEGLTAKHSAYILGNVSYKTHDISVAEGNRGFYISLWKSYNDLFDISIFTPNNEEYQYILSKDIMNRYESTRSTIYILSEKPSPYNIKQEIYISIIPKEDFVENGIWKIVVRPKRIIDGRYDIYLPVENVLSSTVKFLNPDYYSTLTIPSTSNKIITVGSYDSRNNTYSSFSGRGFTTMNAIKPEFTAPGENVVVPNLTRYGYSEVSGTSFSAPYITACAAILMKWGIIDGNDFYMYGERLKAFLISKAMPLKGQSYVPDERYGYGKIDINTLV